jgi:hypothetical protein
MFYLEKKEVFFQEKELVEYLGMAKNFLGGEKTFGKTAAMFGLGGLGAAALQAAGLDTDNPNEMPRDVESLKGYLRSGYLKLNPGARPEDVDAFVEANTREYSAKLTVVELDIIPVLKVLMICILDHIKELWN